MPPLKSSLIKPSKSMLFFHIWNANFSVTPINSQMYMTKPKQVQKKLSENTGKTFSVIMPSFTCRGGHNYGNYSTGISSWKKIPLRRKQFASLTASTMVWGSFLIFTPTKSPLAPLKLNLILFLYFLDVLETFPWWKGKVWRSNQAKNTSSKYLGLEQ